MTMPGEEPEQEAVLASLEEAAAMEETETLVGHSSLDEEEEEEEEKRENERHRRRRQEQQQQQTAASGMEQLTYSRMTHLLAVYQNKVQEGRRVIASLRRQKDSQLQAVISQLLLLEARLRREQKGIVGQLAQRDHVIAAQRQEIDRLRRDNRRLINRLKKVSEACETECREPRLKVSRVEAEEGAMPGLAGHAAPASSSPPGRRSSPGVIRVATSVSELISSGGGKEQRSPGKSPPCVHQVSGRGGSGGGGQRPPPPVNPNVALVRATTDRVFHKPPIAEKPRTSAGRPGRGQAPSQRAQHIVRTHNGKCTIVSTISRLLEEESDATTTGSSEPSSPEATLKPPTPRVIRLARRFEESLAPHQQPAATQAGPTESPDSARRDDRSSKSYIMDEYEVTSGYNSDAVSDHEYENIQVVSCRESEVGKLQQNSHSLSGAKDEGAHETVDGDKAEREEQQEEDEEEDNYVILRAVTENPDSGHWVDIPDDQHIYSNVEFSSGLLIKEIEEEEEEAVAREKEESQRSPEEARNTRRNLRNRCEGEVGQGVLETNLDASPSAPASDGHHSSHVENLRAVKSVNVPRSRHNINLIMESDGDHMTENFEEFTLDSLELEEEREREEEAADRGRGKENLPVHELRRCGDGAETKDGRSKEVQREAVESLGVASPSNYASGQYEKFLEATGLSQKSILTPTRMFSNHRSVLKPRDIKHRNKLRAAFTTLSTLEEAPGPTGGSRYWTEPYL